MQQTWLPHLLLGLQQQLAGKYGIQAWHSFKTRPSRPRSRRFYEVGFQPTMTRWEATLILGYGQVQFSSSNPDGDPATTQSKEISIAEAARTEELYNKLEELAKDTKGVSDINEELAKDQESLRKT